MQSSSKTGKIPQSQEQDLKLLKRCTKQTKQNLMLNALSLQ